MKAVWYEKVGASEEVLVYGDMETPSPKAGEVLVRVLASGVNPSDVKARAGKRAGGSGMPYPRVIPHSDGAGVIEAVGEGVPRSRLNERVWLWNAQWGRAFGTAASYVALPAEQAVPLPDGVSFEVGACLGIPGTTAAHTVFGRGDVAQKTVLVSGGAGTVGYLAVQLAHFGGARVITTARQETDLARLRDIKADAAIPFTHPELAAEILRANQGQLIDRVIEVEFGLNADMIANVIAIRGQIAAYGSALNLRPELPFYPLMFKAVDLEFVLIYLLSDTGRANAIKHLHAALLASALHIPIYKTFPLKACAAAHAAVEAGGREGAVILTID